MSENNLVVLPWSAEELKKLYHVLRNAGHDPERLDRVRPAQIVYSQSWEWNHGKSAGSSAINSVPAEKTLTITNSDASLVTGIRFSVQNPIYGADVKDSGGTYAREWHRADDPAVFAAPRNPLDYISMQVRQTASEQLSTDYVPLSHWEERNRDGWLPSRLDFIPGGNYSSYQLLLRSSKLIAFDRLDVSITAIKLAGL